MGWNVHQPRQPHLHTIALRTTPIIYRAPLIRLISQIPMTESTNEYETPSRYSAIGSIGVVPVCCCTTGLLV